MGNREYRGVAKFIKMKTYGNILQHTTSHPNTLQHTTKTRLWGAQRRRRIHLNKCTLQQHCSTLQHTAAHCSTLQHSTTHCNTLQHTLQRRTCGEEGAEGQHRVHPHRYMLQHVAAATQYDSNCNILQLPATHCTSLQHTTKTHLCLRGSRDTPSSSSTDKPRSLSFLRRSSRIRVLRAPVAKRATLSGLSDREAHVMSTTVSCIASYTYIYIHVYIHVHTYIYTYIYKYIFT